MRKRRRREEKKSKRREEDLGEKTNLPNPLPSSFSASVFFVGEVDPIRPDPAGQRANSAPSHPWSPSFFVPSSRASELQVESFFVCSSAAKPTFPQYNPIPLGGFYISSLPTGGQGGSGSVLISAREYLELTHSRSHSLQFQIQGSQEGSK